jgi:hypothetical protein
MSRKSIGVIAAVTALLSLALAAEGGSASPGARASASFTACNIDGKQQNLGTSYVTALKVAGVSCTKAEKVIKAYHNCRHQNGADGKCTHKVLGFSCKDGKRQGVPGVQYNATAKCRKVSNDAKRIKSPYTQNI